MPKGEETKKARPVEALAAKVDGNGFVMVVEQAGGTFQVSIDLDIDFVNGGLERGNSWLGDVLRILASHLAAGEPHFAERLLALAEEVV